MGLNPRVRGGLDTLLREDRDDSSDVPVVVAQVVDELGKLGVDRVSLRTQQLDSVESVLN